MDDELRILVADDRPDRAQRLAGFLRLNGHEVHIAHSSARALQCAESLQPDCVLIQLDMSEMQDGALARGLREHHGPPLVLIGICDNDELDVALSPQTAQLDHCLRKPLQVLELARMLPLPLAMPSVGLHAP